MSALMPDSATMGNKQYPKTLTVKPTVTPETVIKFSKVYMARQPSTLMP